MKKKKSKWGKVLIIIFLILLICLFFCYKGYFYLIYRTENISDKNYDEFMNSIEIHNDITINKKNVENENYLIYKNVKIRNDFSDYVITYEGDNGRIYRLMDDENNVKAVFKIGVDVTNIDLVLDESMFKKSDKEKFFSKYNISDDIDLLDFVLQKHKTKNTIFTPVKNMREHAMIQYFTFVTLGNPSYITKLTGDYKGYLIGNEKSGLENATLKNINTVNILEDNKKYYFGFWLSDDFTEEYIKDIIETVVIEDNDIDTFTKTYQVLDITPSQTDGKSYLKLKQFQTEDEVTVEVYNSFSFDMEENKYYEFTFQKNGNNIEDNIKSIFENTNLISVNLTDKEGLEQKQDSIK
jgi:hypothetical protein